MDREPPTFNPLDPAFAENPFPILDAMREFDPVMPYGGAAFVVTGHAPADQMLRRKDGDLRWVQFQQQRMGAGVEHEPYCKINEAIVLMTGGERHKRIRSTFQRNFRNVHMEAMREDIRAAAHRLIDGFVADGECELVEQFASPLPLWAISQLLRVPHEDEALIEEWMQGFMLSISLLPLTPEQLAKANHAITSLNDYFAELVAKRRADPPVEDDLLTKMIADADAGTLTEEELVVNAWNLFVGGHDTSKLTTCNGAVTLLQHPEQIPPLLENPDMWPNAVDEVLRYVGPVQGTHRLLPEETELGGHTVPANTPVMVYLSAANHDESWCPHASQFDTARPVPRDHLAFGTGPHKCPGQHMGRVLVHEALQALFTRLPNLRLVECVWDTEVLNFRGPATLRLAWDT